MRRAWKVRSSYVQFMQDHIDSRLVNDRGGLQMPGFCMRRAWKVRSRYVQFMHTVSWSKEPLCSIMHDHNRFPLSQQPHRASKSETGVESNEQLCSISARSQRFPLSQHIFSTISWSKEQLCSIYARSYRFPLSQRPRRASKREAFAWFCIIARLSRAWF